MRRDRLHGLCVFLVLLAVYLAFSGDRFEDFQASDEAIMFQTAVWLVEEGTLRSHLSERYSGMEAKYGLGQSLAGVPLYCIARALAGPLPAFDPATADQAAAEAALRRWKAAAFPLACATNAILCAAIGAMFFAVARRLGYGSRAAIAGALVVGTATIIAPYSKTFFSEPLVALSLLGAAGALAAPADQPPSARQWFRAGAWLAVAILTRIDNAVLVPVFLAGLLLGTDSRQRQQALRGTALYLLPLAVVVLIILWTNWLRSGRAAGGGYSGEGFSTLFATGLFGLLFSPAHGVFWYSPPVALALFYGLRFHRRHSRLAFVVFATALTKLFLFAKWWNWFGGWSWGSRFLLPIVPLLMLALLDPLSRWRTLRRTEKALIGALWAAGIVVQLSGMLVAANAFHSNIQFLAGAGSGRVQPIADREQLLVFSPPQSPLVGNWSIVHHGPLDWFALRFDQFYPASNLTVIFAILGVMFLIGLLGLVYAYRRDASAATACVSTEALNPDIGQLSPLVRRAAWVLLVLNVLALAALALALRANNGLTRTDREEYADGRTVERSHRVAPVYLDSQAEAPPGLLSRSTEWIGYIETPTSGQYTFYTVAWGAFDLQLAGRTLLSNNATEDRRSQRVDTDPTQPIPRGIHSFRLRYHDPLPASDDRSTTAPLRRYRRLIQLYWTIPGGGEYMQVIGRAWFYPTRPAPTARLIALWWRLKAGIVLVSILIVWWLWLHTAQHRPQRNDQR